MSTEELIGRWERLLAAEWPVLASVGQSDWEPPFLAYLAEKDRLLRETPSHRLPGELIDRLTTQQRRLKLFLPSGAGRRPGIYDREAVGRR